LKRKNSSRIHIFILTYITYATYYLTRLNFSVALPSIAMDLGYPKFMLGLIGGAFSMVYALGQLINGQLAERFGAKKLITIGLLLSATVNILFGYTEMGAAMILLWAVNGYAQSTGWPSVVKIISEWFGEGSRGKISGLFGTCFLVGSIAALTFSGYILSKFGWRALFLLPPMILIILVIPFNLGVRNRDRAYEENGYDPKSSRVFSRLILSRKILTVTAAYILLQFVRSGFSLWAPSYIFEVYGASLEYASYGAAIIPIGGVAGSIISGWMSDKLEGSRRVPIMAVMTLSLCFTLLLLYRSMEFGLTTSITLLFLGGLTLYGPHVLMVTTVPMDYNRRYGAAGIAGFIDGLGYVGSTFANPFIGWIVDSKGWNGAVTFWVISAFCSTLLIFTLWGSEDREP